MRQFSPILPDGHNNTFFLFVEDERRIEKFSFLTTSLYYEGNDADI
jgi:hypothetical protein